MEPIELSRKIANVLEEKLAENILILDISDISDFTDCFVIATASSPRLLRSLIKAIDEEIKEQTGYNPIIEGANNEDWVVMDYAYVVVHLFSEDARNYYDIEELWEAGKVVLSLQ
ncbi:MAG: ribosome silencing factor [Chloroflexi bacterium]|nr:ribosome silencing factor [Chloroflexota bacterium]